MRKEELYYPSRDNHTQIHAVRWIPEGETPDCIVQIVHGMAEYAERYEDCARFLTEHNILVTAEDHLGHGKSIRTDRNPGYFCEQDPATVAVRDVHRLKKITQEKYPGIPYVILGHSMGSFMVRDYLSRYGNGINGVIIVGTGVQSELLLSISLLVANIQRIFKGDNHISHFINKCAFGSYNNKIENPRTSKDWLTRDDAIVDAYLMDELCGFTFTVNGFRALFELIKRTQNNNNIKKIPDELPMFIISGDADPVGNYGKGVEAFAGMLENVGKSKVEMKLYKGARHEILNELQREHVYEDIYAWITGVVNGK